MFPTHSDPETPAPNESQTPLNPDAASEADSVTRVVDDSKPVHAPHGTGEVFDETVSFETLGLRNSVLKGIQACGFLHPTKTQALLLPAIMSGKDILGQAKTGTGKTAAFALPLLHSLEKDKQFQALILAPTRELAMQITAEIDELGQFTPIRSVCLFGGQAVRQQAGQIERGGGQIIVGTPGRIMDMLERRLIHFNNVKVAVLDEVDRMVDSGFGPAVNRIVEACGRPPLVLLSATTQNLLENSFISLRNPLVIKEEESAVPATLKQEYCVVPTKLRLAVLISMLQESDTHAIVFVSCRDVVDYFAVLLKRFCTATIFALHGSLEASERTRILQEFKKSTAGVLVCTDVVARGIDFSRIPLVLQFEPPGDRADYIHRIGRSARQGQAGRSCLFLLEHELPYLDMLGLPITKRGAFAENAFKTLDKISYILKGDKELKEKAEKAYRSSIRAYATHVKDERAIFHPKLLHLGHYAGSFGIQAAPEDSPQPNSSKQKTLKSNSLNKFPTKPEDRGGRSKDSNSRSEESNSRPEGSRNRLSNKPVKAPAAPAAPKKRIVSEFDAY